VKEVEMMPDQTSCHVIFLPFWGSPGRSLVVFHPSSENYWSRY
jgi:hypothetical protein